MVKKTQVIVYIEQDEDGMYGHAQGDTQEEMFKNLGEVAKLCLRNLDKKLLEV